jgi:Chaperone of endosialidase
MAVTIVRTNWIDDDGSGTVGTVINNAVKTDLYNQIDGALAKVPQLAGGNNLSGDQSIAGFLKINTATQAARLSIADDGATSFALGLQNINPAGGMYYVVFYNSAMALAGSIYQSGDTTVAYNTSSDARLKADAGPATDLSALRAVVVHDFTWKGAGVRDRGIFAQEAYALYPRAVSPGTDETTARGDLARPWMTDYSKFVPDLIVGWQQHDAELAELRATLARLLG